MKRVLKLTLFVVILIMTMMMSKTVLADERKDAKVDYEYNSDGTAKVTITFSESVEGFNTLIESGWQLSGNTATKTMNPGEWYIYMSDTEQAKVVVNNIAKVGDTITINSSSNKSTLKNLRLDDESYGTVSGNKITFNKEGETSYLADVTYVKDENTVGNFELRWNVKITKDGKKYNSHLKVTVTDTLGKYSNLTDLNTQNEVKKYLIDAGVSKKNVEAWLKDVNEYNKTIKNTSLVKKGYKKLGLNVPVYNDTKIAEYWSKKYNMFIGYNCRITAFDLLKDYVKIGKNVKTDTTELFMDSDALKNSPYQKYNKKDTKKFEALYSSINTVYSTNTDKHISVFKKYRKKNDIKLANDKTKASLITVVFHSSFSKKENELFIGHAGVLVPLKNKKYIFIEKLSFQSPYQVIKFESKQQLNEYLMRMYDTEWGQDTAKPFIMENNDVLSCYHSVR